jgi:ATP/maltotriose-dependent transcriptional regulator MalT
MAARSAALVGRQAEITRFRELFEGLAAAETTRLVLVEGDPGVGKTRLLTEATALAERAGRMVLWGRATEFERHRPFGIFADALEDHLATVGPGELSHLGPDVDGLLQRVLPTVAWSDRPPVDLIAVERYRLHRAVRLLLESLAEPEGLVLVLDDLHWADDGSTELMEHLMRHPPRAPLVLILTCRPRQMPERLWQALSAGSGGTEVERMELGPLTRAEADQLLPEGFDETARRRLYDESGGNPFYLQALALVRARCHQGPAGAVHSEGVMPAHVQAVLAAEFDTLTPAQRLTAGAAAVTGDCADVELVTEISGLPFAEVLEALNALEASDILRPAGSGGRLRFRHPLVRRAAYEVTGPGWRVGAHAHAAAVLRDRGAHVTEQAHHVERSARPGDAEAVRTLSDAGRDTLNTSPATAAHWLRAALRALGADESSLPLRVELLSLYAQALGATGRLNESRQALHEVLGLLPAEQAAQRTRTVITCARIERLLGHYDEATALLSRELANIDDGDAATSHINLELAAGQMLKADFGSQSAWAADSLVAARRTGDPVLLALGLAVRVVYSSVIGPVGEQERLRLDEAAALVDAMTDRELGSHLDTAILLGWGEIILERAPSAVRHLRRGLEVARAEGDAHPVAHLHVALGVALGQLGNLEAAAGHFEDGEEAAALSGSEESRHLALANRCWIATWSGDLDSALRMGEQALSGAVADNLSHRAAGEMLAQARLYAGDPAGFADQILEAAGGLEMPATARVSRPKWYELLAAASSAQGRQEESAAWADRAQAAAEGLGMARCTGHAQLARVHPLLLADPAAAVPWAQAAAETFAGVGDRVETGRAHLLTGMALAAADEADPAREAFATARDLFRECGAHLFLKQALREERRMNARLPGADRRPVREDTTASSPDLALTAREKSIAELVAQGLTNRQIADRLHLSSKTVEAHLTRIYAKLGIARRAEVAEQLRDRHGASLT